MGNSFTLKSINFYSKSVFSFLLIIFMSATSPVKAEILTAITSGTYLVPSVWDKGTIPAVGDTIIVQSGVSLSLVSVNTPILGDVTIQAGATLTVLNAATASLNFGGDLKVYGTLINNGRVAMINPAAFILGPGAVYDHNPRANIAADESMFENGTENIDPTSTLIIRKWASTSLPLIDPTRINGNGGNIGNLITSVTGTTWEQRGRFSPDKIKGDYTITDGVVRMDDGSGMSTTLTLNNLILRGNSAIIFQEGNSRSLTLTMQSFTDSSTLVGQPSIIMNGSLGNLNCTVNGNFITRHDFIAINDSTFPIRSANANITINGKLLIQGINNKFDFCRQVNAPLTLTVTDSTVIRGLPTYVRFIDSGNGVLNFTTNTLTITAGTKNVFLGGNEYLDVGGLPLFPLPTGVGQINVLSDFSLSGNSNTTGVLSTSNVNRFRVVVGRDFTTSSFTSVFNLAKSIGPATLMVGRDMNLNGGNVDIQSNVSSNAIDSIIVQQNFVFNSALATNYFRANSGAGNTIMHITGDFTLTNSGTTTAQGVCGNYLNNGSFDFYTGGNFTITNGAFYGIQDGTGLNTFVVNGAFNQSGGYFKGTHATNIITAGKSKFTLGSFNFTGGNFIQYNAANDSVVCIVNGNFSVNYAAVSSFVSFIPYSHAVYSNSSPLKLVVNGSMTFDGANGTFYSSVSQGNENITITNNLTFNNGNNSFNLFPSSIINATHDVTMSIGGNLTSANGNNYLSAGRGDLTANVDGNMLVSGGSISLKGNSAFNPVNFNIKGGYTQSNGTFYFHNNATIAPVQTTVTVNSDDDNSGDFVQSGGTINVLNNTLNPNPMTLEIKSPNYTIGPGGTISHAGSALVENMGLINFSRTGTTLFTRIAGHSVTNMRQFIYGGTTVEVISGDMQLASYIVDPMFPNQTMLDIKSFGTLTLRNNSSVYSNGLNPKCYMNVNNDGRLRLQHTNGLYSGFSNAAIKSDGDMLYYLYSQSIVEYFGDDNQIITGIGMGTALTSGQKYAILDINFGGDPATEYVYPTNNGTVYVRTELRLTSGQLRLDDDNNPVSGGRSITIEKILPTGITRTNGYIRAETYDGASLVIWRFANNTSPRIIPFGIDASTYIPLTLTCTSGNAGFVSVSTYKTNAANIPYPPAVGHVNSSITGTDASGDCVDRFWKIHSDSLSATFSATFSAPVAEFPAVVGPYKAQHYNYNGGIWDNPFQGVQSYNSAGAIRTVTATGITNYNDWWVLVNQNNPLPVELLSFNANCQNNKRFLSWTTASELNNDFFKVEKSINGTDFNFFRKVSGNGTTSSISNYEITDENSSDIGSYYRLSQVDFNGESKELKTIYAVSCNTDKLELISVSQYREYINTVVSSPSDQSVEITIIDFNGKTVSKSSANLASGISTVKILSSLATGIYYLQLKGNDESIVSGKKFIIN
ncbi:MAG: T9SS C-terminal target domain-containing protein [Bacteroidetes bacterium CHB6]|nr:T9SS C-terminal target domain-containing protein [Bacteroidetes bacterium CHB6]